MMKRRCVAPEPALVRLPTDLLQLVLSFAESSLPRILEWQLISWHFRNALSKSNVLSSVPVVLRRPTDIHHLGDMVAGVRTVKFLFAATTLRALPIMSSLRSLDLSGCKLINNETINIVSYLSKLQKLNVSNCPRITDLSKLAVLAGLTHLDISCCYEVRYVPPVTTLEILDMDSCCAVTSWSALATLKSLSALCLSSCHVDDSALRGLPAGLRKLDLGYCRNLTDACLPDIARSKNLEFLNLTGCGKLACLDPLAALKSLVEVKLMFCIGIETLSAFSHMPQLRMIYAPHTELTCESFKHSFENLPSLNYLELSYSRLTHVALHHPLVALQKLELRSCHMLHDLSNLGFCRQLAILDLSGCRMVSEHSLASLVHVPNLQHLDLNSCLELTDESLRQVAKLSELRYLNLNGCVLIKNAGMEHLSALAKLETLELQGCLLVSDAGLHAISGLREMRKLNLSFLAGLTDAGLFALMSMIELVWLNLDSCRKITDIGLHALRPLPKLACLDLSRCRGVETLCPLKSMTSLRVINLAGCVRVNDASLINLVQCKNLDVQHSHCRKITRHGLLMMRQLMAS
jgi:Leucine-rich repeat (LRR) protein